MIKRAGWWLLMRWPSARLWYQGALDGQVGMLPQMIGNRYYMGGYKWGQARFLDRSIGKA